MIDLVSRNRKLIVGFVILLFLAISVGCTLAYFHNVYSLPSSVSSDRFSTRYYHYFNNPDLWEPGSVIEANISVTNESDFLVAVRASIVEEWLDSSENVLSNTYNGNDIVQKNINSDWKFSNGYYYYKNILNKNGVTSNFITTAVFSNVFGDDLKCVDQGDGTKKCSVAGAYSDGSYQLKVIFEVIQANVYKEEWNVDLDTL